MAEVHPDPSTFGQPEVAPVAAPAPEPAPSIAQVEAQVEVVAHEVEQIAAAEIPAPAEEHAPESTPVAPRAPLYGWHVLSGLSNGVTLPPSKR